MTPILPLLAVPNVSEGREQATVQAIAQAFKTHGMGRLLDVHSDADHHRSVFTLAGLQGELSSALLAGAKTAVERIDVGEGRNPADIGEHPHVGAIDVMPVVYLEAAQRGGACAEALVVAHMVGERLGVPVFLYGELARRRTRADLRRGGVAGLAERMKAGELRPDFGPSQLHPTAGATLVAAREPLVAFNLELAPPASVEDARRIASLIREGGSEGLPGVRAIGVSLRRAGRGSHGYAPERNVECAPEAGVERVGKGHVERVGKPDGGWDGKLRKEDSFPRVSGNRFGDTIAQVSMNVERPLDLPLSTVVEAVRRHSEIACAELVGLVPRASMVGFPVDIPLGDFDPGVHVIENALGF
jgi:glutamate formiminotransferase/glutamate formiminotransferase/formiminotetrahydrofolate cyclodeaminase